MIRRVFGRVQILVRAAVAALGGLSLVVCAAALVFWARGYWVVDVVEVMGYRAAGGDVTTTVHRVSNGKGVVVFAHSRRWNAYFPGTSVKRDAQGRWVEVPRAPPPDAHSRRVERTSMEPDRFQVLGTTPWQRLGFNAYSGGDEKLGRGGQLAERNRYGGLRVPHWLVVLLTGAPGFLSLRSLAKLRRRSRIRRGLCARCAYDLRATRDRCPECGEAVPCEVSPSPPAGA
jgi:hypothetical protein